MIIKDNQMFAKPVLLAIAALGWAVVIYLAWIVGFDSYMRSTFAFATLSGVAGLPDDPFNQRYVDHPWLTLMHTIPGMLFAVLGPLQFASPLRDNFRVVHRTCGKIFIVIAAFSGTSALLMGLAFPVWGYSYNQAVTTVWSAFLLYCLYRAYTAIRARQVPVHREWMIRAFTTGLSVAWFRFMLRFVLPPMGFEFTEAWNIVVAVSAPTALLAAEFWIRATRPRVARGAAPAPA